MGVGVLSSILITTFKHKMDKETIGLVRCYLRWVLCQAHDIHICFVAHPTKMMRREDGTIPVPRGYDISGSKVFSLKQTVGTIDRPDPSKQQTDVHIWKVDIGVGKQGKTSFTYDS